VAVPVDVDPAAPPLFVAALPVAEVAPPLPVAVAVATGDDAAALASGDGASAGKGLPNQRTPSPSALAA
jgi:hypothetical protein